MPEDRTNAEQANEPGRVLDLGWLRTALGRVGGRKLRLGPAWRNWVSAAHIGAHLASVVLLTGAVTFAVVGLVALLRLRDDAVEQAGALAQLSRQQVARRLDAEARLAEARLGVLFDEASRQTRYLAQRLDIVKAVVSANHVAIQELLAPASVTGELDALLVADATGTVIGASRATDLLAASEAIAALGLKKTITSIFKDNRRLDRRAHHATYRVLESFNAAVGLPPGRIIAHVAIEPVFDDFGDVAGALVGLRTLAPSERTFELFSGIVQAGVVVSDGERVISAGGEPATDLKATTSLAPDRLIATAGDRRVARCVESELGLLICAHVEAAQVEETQREMQRISERQAGTLFHWFLALAAGSLGVLVAVVLVSVKRVTSGLPQLARAATSVARGDLDIPFNASGIGEVRSLGQAFEVMLSNLRESLGRIRQLAFFDQVTELANREKIRLDGVSALASRKDDVAFLFIDVDRFKSINDTFGHKMGDVLLRQLASRLNQFFKERQDAGDFKRFWAGRLSGDEFLIILSGVLSVDGLRDCAEALIKRLGDTYVIGSAHMTVGASIGIAIAGQDGAGYDDLLVKADIAMYEAKRQGRNSFAFFTADAAEIMQERLAIEQELRAALKDGSLNVFYQPMISLVDGRVVGAEALVRWSHPLRGDIPPGKFISIAEDAGLIAELGLFVLTRAIDEAYSGVARGADITIAVNVSVLQLDDPTFAASVEECLLKAGVPPSRLELEITESVAMRASDIVQRQLKQLRALGIRFSIDDFGTGYSNLSMLARLQFDTLKIDRSLVHGVSASAEQQAIVRTILALARSLGFSTVVEGVEQPEDLTFMIDEGADVAQGYLFSEALPIESLGAFVNSDRLRRMSGLAKTFVRQPQHYPEIKRRSR